ncbi:nuclease A inhibitor family protein [Nannocystis radixulma]|uniref:Nuclease A inhibitor family protein n=1 Tax=Nannocystis radixulma TaxID=2995305 RepID=A0ABT5BP81_9BACT|nr:nuclease A inhibitor family protein [Nannocystis radixulma]MDC0675203.1 nuclease A inhibitor family protein [Nannocystis radixulma]
MSIRPRLLATFAVVLACSPTEPATTDDSTDGTGTDATTTSTSAPTTGEPTTGDGTVSATGDSTTDASTTGDSTTDAITSSVDTTTTTGDETTTTMTGDETTTTTGDDTTTTTGDTTTTGETTTTGDTDSTTGDEGLGAAAEAAIDALEVAVDGVLWTSESDYPWTVFGLADAAPVTVDNFKELIGPLVVIEDWEAPLEEQVIEEEPWQDIFLDMTTPQDWWTDYELMRAEQYEAIQEVLETHLINLKMFRIGEQSGMWLSGAIDMFVIGETADGDLVGIQTITVET